jgi:hypothetical protein
MAARVSSPPRLPWRSSRPRWCSRSSTPLGRERASRPPKAKEYSSMPKPAAAGTKKAGRLQAPGPRLQAKQFLEPGVWSLKSLPSCTRSRAEGTIPPPTGLPATATTSLFCRPSSPSRRCSTVRSRAGSSLRRSFARTWTSAGRRGLEPGADLTERGGPSCNRTWPGLCYPSGASSPPAPSRLIRTPQSHQLAACAASAKAARPGRGLGAQSLQVRPPSVVAMN